MTARREPVAARGERKLVTIVFADLTGYTALAASLDPEEVYRFLRPTMASLQRVVEEFGGTVPQVMGDGFMAVFGVPVAHEDDAERAVRAALAVRDHVRELNRGREGLPFPEVHAGVNSGEVMVGPSGEQAGFAVVGDTVNTASRLADLARGRHVLVDEQTKCRTIGAIRYGSKVERRAKGKALPLATYEALGARSPVPASRVGRARTPGFVNRDEVLERLQEELREAERAERSRVLVLTGEPGMGKSRLADEFGRRLRRGSVLTGRCVPFGQRFPLHALAEAVGGVAGVTPGASKQEADAAVRKLVTGIGRARAGNLARDLHLLLGTGHVPTGQSRGSVHDAVRAARTVVEGLAQDRPVAIVLDDLHWADPDLLGLLDSVQRAPWNRPVLFLGLSRPEPVVRGLPKLPLSALDDGAMRTLAGSVLGRGVPEQVLSTPIERAGGNPLFLEESLGMLIEAGVLRAEEGRWSVADAERLRAVPSSIRLLIAARLDGLPPDEKHVLQDASVCGEAVWDRLIELLSELTDPRATLRSLESRGLLRRRRGSLIPGAIEYEFKHVLICDVAYQSLPRAERAGRHLQIAEWLRAQAPARRSEPVALIAHHYEQAWRLGLSRTGPPPPAETAARAVSYLRRWADQTFAYQARAAEGLYARAVRVADGSGLAVDPAETAAALIGRAECLIEMGRHREAGQEAARARSLADGLGDRTLEARALLSLGRCESDLGRMRGARVILEEARSLFESQGDVRGQGWVAHRLSETWGRSDYRRELDDLREAHRLFVRSREQWGRTVAALDLAYLFSTTGGPEFQRWYEEARSLANNEGDLRSKASLLRTWGYVSHYRGEYAEALRVMREARPMAVQAGDRYAEADAVLQAGLSAIEAGDPQEAERLAAEGLALARELESGRVHGSALLIGARAAVRMGRPDLGTRRLRSARAVFEGQVIRVLVPELRLAEAAMNLDRGLWGPTREALRGVPGMIHRNGWSLWECLPPLYRGRALLGEGRFRAALRELSAAARLADSAGATGTLALARSLRSQASLLAGDGGPPGAAGRPSEPERGAIDRENRGIRAARAGDHGKAATRFAEAVELWEGHGKTVWLARALGLQAEALRRAGDGRRAAGADRRALRILDALKTPAATRRSLAPTLGG